MDNRTCAVFAAVVVPLLAQRPQASACIMLDEVPENEYLSYAADPMFESAGCIYANYETNGWLRGSGVLIHPEWVLTAGHNLVWWIDPVSEVRFYTGTDIGEADHIVCADAWFVHPDWIPGTQEGGTGVDLGLIHLSEPITDITCAEVFHGEDERGTLLHMAGYGKYGWASTGPVDLDYLRRGWDNIAADFGGDPGFLLVESQYWLAEFGGVEGNLPLEGHGAPGDSGSGCFAYIDGRYQLVGINAFAWGGFGLGSETGAIRTSLYTDWVDTYVPEPVAALLFAAAAPWILCRRRKRA